MVPRHGLIERLVVNSTAATYGIAYCGTPQSRAVPFLNVANLPQVELQHRCTTGARRSPIPPNSCCFIVRPFRDTRALCRLEASSFINLLRLKGLVGSVPAANVD
jgi:hypothetical protein